MRRACYLFPILVLGGCGKSPESQVAGTWQVDPASITISRLLPGPEKRPDWTDATNTMSGLTLKFSSQPNSVTATGMDQSSTGTWALRGDSIEVQGKADHWPQMTFDPRSNLIHANLDQDGDHLSMNFVKKK